MSSSRCIAGTQLTDDRPEEPKPPREEEPDEPIERLEEDERDEEAELEARPQFHPDERCAKDGP